MLVEDIDRRHAEQHGQCIELSRFELELQPIRKDRDRKDKQDQQSVPFFDEQRGQP